MCRSGDAEHAATSAGNASSAAVTLNRGGADRRFRPKGHAEALGGKQRRFPSIMIYPSATTTPIDASEATRPHTARLLRTTDRRNKGLAAAVGIGRPTTSTSLGEIMHDTIFVSRWGPATRSLTRLILAPSFERPAPTAAASSDVDAFYRCGRD
jgi:hypothetical protein